MWFVSQIQNALSGNEPNEQCFMDSDRGTTEEQTPSNKKPNPKSHIKSSKPSTPKNQYLTRKYHDVGKKTSNNFLYSTECMELPSTSSTHKRYSVFEPKKLSDEGVRSETKECAVPRLLDKAPSDDVVPLKRESSRICIKTAPSRPNYNSKISFTSLNYVHDLARSKMSRSSLRHGMSYMNSSACNELDICTTSNEIESVSRPSSAKKCTQCDSVTTITCTNCNKIEKSDVSKDDSVSDITVRFKPEILKSSKDSSKLKKPEPVCVYKRDKKGADANVRRSFRTKKKTDEKIPVPMNQSKIEVITKSGNEKIHEHTRKDFVKSKAQYQKRNELPIHLRPLSPVHNLQPNVFRKSSNIFDDVMPEKSNIKSIYANEPECTSPAYDGLCKKICLNNCGCKDMCTSMDFEDLSEEKMLPITTYRYNAKTRPSSVSRLTKIPVPNTTYCVGYSKISSVQEKVSYITGSYSQDLGNILYCQEDEFKPCKGASIETPNICQKRIIQRPRSNIQPKRSNLTDPKINKKLAIENEVSLTKPTDLIKRIEMIRRKLAEADCGDTNVEDKNISLKRSRLFYRLGERGSGIKSTGPVQDFYELRDQHLSSGTLFEDPQFPADDTSLTISRRPDRRYEWLRPGEIVDNPQLFVEGYSRFDVQQGELGDCWLLAAVANLTLYRRLFFQIVPDDQSFDENYAGIFHFRFWQYGRWVDVVIDDRLPTYRGQLVYLHSNEENEFWSALLEKAYAKLHGCYEALKGGSTCDAMEDFTGGVTEMYEMNSSPPNLFKIIMKAYERGSLMGSSLEPDPNVLEAETREGLVRGHAYSITRVKYVDIQTPNTVGKIPLLRLRNPWGNEIEWNGAWSDQSPEWRFIPDHEKENLGLTFDHDGEFWMSFKDFQKHFDRLEICNLTPDSLTEEEIAQGNKKQWEMSVFEGEWVRGVTSGGCRNYLETFWHNPQYRITLNESDDDDEEGKCTVIIALMQKNRRSRKMQGVEFLTIGFAVYYLPDPNRAPKPLDLNYFKYNASVARSPSFINLREVSCRFRLPPGTYCIVPSTFEPNDEGEFLLRVFSEHKNNMEEHDHTIALRVEKTTPAAQTHPQTPTEDRKQSDQVREYFKKIAGDDMEVDWEELKDILDFATRTETKNRGFSKDVARSIVALLDEDRSGKLGFEEFVSLWGLIRKSKAVFQKHDKDGTGSLNGFELREALTSVGYTLNNHILNILMHRYGNKQAEISFDDFILCGIKLKTMIEIFRKKNVSGGLSISVSFDDWIETTLYA